MSATGRGGEKPDLDFAPTPVAAARAMVSLIPSNHIQHRRVLEPSCGSGRIVEQLNRVHGVVPDVVEVAPDRYDLSHVKICEEHHTPYTRFMRPSYYDYIVANPPFSLAAQHIQHSMYLLKPGGYGVFLLRAGFMHAPKRDKHLSRYHTWFEWKMRERPAFYGDGNTDATEYAILVFRRPIREEPERDHCISAYFRWKDTSPIALVERDQKRIVALWERHGPMVPLD